MPATPPPTPDEIIASASKMIWQVQVYSWLMDYPSARSAALSAQRILNLVGGQVESARRKILNILNAAMRTEASEREGMDAKDLAIKLAPLQMGDSRKFVSLVPVDRITRTAVIRLQGPGQLEGQEGGVGHDSIAEVDITTSTTFTLLSLGSNLFELRAFQPNGIAIREPASYERGFREHCEASSTVVVERTESSRAEGAESAGVGGTRMWVYGTDFFFDVSVIPDGVAWGKLFLADEERARSYASAVMRVLTSRQ